LLGQGVTILNSTAYLDEAERCHRLALLHNGSLLFSDTPHRLKENFRGDVIAIVSEKPADVYRRVTAIPGVNGAVMVGDAVHAFVDDAARRTIEIRTALDAASAAYSEVLEVPPTIEDLFVSAVRNREAADA
jgi:ABC-2 type transport system ATP-binding protein